MDYFEIGNLISAMEPDEQEMDFTPAAAREAGMTVVVKAPDVYLDGEKISRDTTERQYEDAAVRRL